VSTVSFLHVRELCPSSLQLQEQISESTDLAIPAACLYQIQTLDDDLDWAPEESFTDPMPGVLKADGVTAEIVLWSNSISLLAGLWNDAKISVDSLNSAFDKFSTAASNYMRSLQGPFSQSIPKNITQYYEDSGEPSAPVLFNHVFGSPEDWNQPVKGEAFVVTTCINVRWPWLVLPAAIFLATIVFLIMLIIKTTSDHEREVWKSSQNALIWHGLDGTAEEESDTLITKKDMDKRAKEIKVQPGKTRMGWKLVQDE
jgi:hypothetical protein